MVAEGIGEQASCAVAHRRRATLLVMNINKANKMATLSLRGECVHLAYLCTSSRRNFFRLLFCTGTKTKTNGKPIERNTIAQWAIHSSMFASCQNCTKPLSQNQLQVNNARFLISATTAILIKSKLYQHVVCCWPMVWKCAHNTLAQTAVYLIMFHNGLHNLVVAVLYYIYLLYFCYGTQVSF